MVWDFYLKHNLRTGPICKYMQVIYFCVSRSRREKFKSSYMIFEIDLPVERKCKFSWSSSEFTVVGKPLISSLSDPVQVNSQCLINLIAIICDTSKKASMIIISWAKTPLYLSPCTLLWLVEAGRICFNVDTFPLVIVLTVVNSNKQHLSSISVLLVWRNIWFDHCCMCTNAKDCETIHRCLNWYC